jgi:hypothetical protein
MSVQKSRAGAALVVALVFSLGVTVVIPPNLHLSRGNMNTKDEKSNGERIYECVCILYSI